MIPRVLEPEAMDTPEESRDYDAMDHAAVNERFVADFLAAHGPCRGGTILDVGTGPARIPIRLCREDANARVLGIDLARHMLALAARNVADAGLADRIRLALADAKELSLDDGPFEAVISNTIVHHVPRPELAMASMARLVAPGGMLFVRDLTRPETNDDVDQLVATHAGSEGPEARAMFAASLHAALTLAEARALASEFGGEVNMTSGRHWTWTWRRPGWTRNTSP